MKTFITSLILAASVIGACADAITYRVEIKNIVTQIQQTPQFQVSGPKEKKSNPRYWLEIEAELEVESSDHVSFIPEIIANWSAIIKDSVTEKGKPKTMMLTGKVSFREIRTKEKTVFISAYISPDTLEKLTGKDRPSEREVEAVALVISGTGIASDGKYAAGLQKATAAEDTKWWMTSKYPAMDGFIIAKAKTPFAPLWSDRYPIEKPE